MPQGRAQEGPALDRVEVRQPRVDPLRAALEPGDEVGARHDAAEPPPHRQRGAAPLQAHQRQAEGDRDHHEEREPRGAERLLIEPVEEGRQPEEDEEDLRHRERRLGDHDRRHAVGARHTPGAQQVRLQRLAGHGRRREAVHRLAGHAGEVDGAEGRAGRRRQRAAPAEGVEGGDDEIGDEDERRAPAERAEADEDGTDAGVIEEEREEQPAGEEGGGLTGRPPLSRLAPPALRHAPPPLAPRRRAGNGRRW